MQNAAERAPGEPAVWANRGVLAAQQNDLEAAARHFERARSLAPDHAPLWLLSGLLERERGNYDRAQSHLERAIKIDSTNTPALYALAQVSEQEGGDTALRDARRLVNRLLAQRPDNLLLLVERARLAAKARDEEVLIAITEFFLRLVEFIAAPFYALFLVKPAAMLVELHWPEDNAEANREAGDAVPDVTEPKADRSAAPTPAP